jgi:hypothetical protein
MLAQLSREFVDLLKPEGFDQAELWISGECVYFVGNHELRGSAIIDSFRSNHEQASQRLDSVVYLNSELEGVDGRKVSIIVTDKIRVGQRTHLYRDRLILTWNEEVEPKVARIENRRVDGERKKLIDFFAEVGLEWHTSE